MMLRKILLGSGILSSPLYVAADILAARRYKGYSYRDQTVSELLAEGGPTRAFMIAAVAIPYNLLVAALTAGIWASSRQNRAARMTAVLLGAYTAVSTAGGLLFPMTPRGTTGKLHNIMHIPDSAAQGIFMILSLATGAKLLDKRFAYYTYATLAIVLVFGGLAGLQGSRIAKNEPTPWAGVQERLFIYAILLWLALLAGALMKDRDLVSPNS